VRFLNHSFWVVLVVLFTTISSHSQLLQQGTYDVVFCRTSGYGKGSGGIGTATVFSSGKIVVSTREPGEKESFVRSGKLSNSFVLSGKKGVSSILVTFKTFNLSSAYVSYKETGSQGVGALVLRR